MRFVRRFIGRVVKAPVRVAQAVAKPAAQIIKAPVQVAQKVIQSPIGKAAALGAAAYFGAPMIAGAAGAAGGSGIGSAIAKGALGGIAAGAVANKVLSGGQPAASPAESAADRMERERRAKIEASVKAINGIFGNANRQKMYSEQRDSVFNLNKMSLDREAQEAGRQNKFGLMRNGLIGSSVQAQSEADLNRRTNDGLLQVSRVADQAASDLKVADERTRSNLISMAQTGIDSSTAQQQALNGLQLNAEQAKSQRTAASVQGLFNDVGSAYLIRQQMGAMGDQAGTGGFYGVPANKRSYQGVTY